MTWRRPSERHGYVRVLLATGDAYDMPPTTYEALTHAMEQGRTFFEGAALLGDPFLIRLDAVVAIGLTSVAGLVAYDAEEDDRMAHERLHGPDT